MPSAVSDGGKYPGSQHPLPPNPPTPHHGGNMAAETKDIIQDFLSCLQYRPPGTVPNARLRADVTAEIISWKAGLSAKFIAGLTDTACTIVESALAHTSYAHQRLLSFYSAYIIYVDDFGSRDLEALGRFGQRIAARESQGDPVLERLARQFGDMYAMYPRAAADLINTATLAGVAGTHIEFCTEHMAVAPGALGYPQFLRGMTGYSTAYAFFNFVKDWRDPADSFYLQIVPELVLCTDRFNDILSFYKETLDGETNTYIHHRAKAENVDALVILRNLCEETLDSIRRIGDLTASDSQLADICRGYLMGNVEFYFRASRYRLAELQIEF
ncbi:hypothetical protein VTO73DRAFT_5324 [Trametes versicolor]